MAPKESAVWDFVVKETTTNAGNARGLCKCCGKTQTTSAGQWWTHIKDNCSGSKDPELLEHAQVAADKHFAAEPSKKSRSGRFKQASVTNLNKQQLQAQADEAIARWAFATGQPLRAVDDFFFRDALEKVAAAGSGRKHLGRKRLKEQMIPAERKRVKRSQKAAADLNKDPFSQSLVSDGYTDANRRPLIKMLLVFPGGELFMEAVDTSGNTKSMQFIADHV
jgi:hypothetical protein